MKQRKLESQQTALYDMGAICNLTGLTPHVLRSWESRYAIVAPRRLKNGRRAYSPKDLNKLQKLKILTARGHRIGTLANLDDNQLEARLREIGISDDGSRPQAGSIIGITLIGETLKLQSQNWQLSSPNYIEARYSSLEEATADSTRPVNEVIVLELPTVHQSTLGRVTSILKELSGQHALVSYRFGPQMLLSRVTPQNVTLCPGVMTQERLTSELARLTMAGQVQAVRHEPVRARRYTHAQLAHIASLSPSVACECPRHVSSLLTDLSHFEDYSAECESLKTGDEELHRFLTEITARARNLMEQAMAKVIDQEHLTI
jgi:DNA-binding transcriptional MerR regulator